MTERPSQNKQIIAKLDEVSTAVNAINMKLARIETQIEMQPVIDREQHLAIAERFVRVENRVEIIEDDHKWQKRLIIGTVFSSIVALIIGLIRFI